MDKAEETSRHRLGSPFPQSNKDLVRYFRLKKQENKEFLWLLFNSFFLFLEYMEQFIISEKCSAAIGIIKINLPRLK